MEIATALAAISSAKEFASLVISRKVDTAVTDKAIELQSSIIALQSALLEMQSKIQTLGAEKADLERALAESKRWEEIEATHHLFPVGKGVHVYVHNEFIPEDPSTPWYCATCWQKRFQSVLHYKTQDYGGTLYYCPNCKAAVYDHTDPAPIG